MCAGAIVNARIRTLVFGCSDPKAGAVRSLMQIADDARLNHRAKVIEGIEAEACTKRLRDFFSALRKQGKK
jgi:tRNA(adenine34) deaminase